MTSGEWRSVIKWQQSLVLVCRLQRSTGHWVFAQAVRCAPVWPSNGVSPRWGAYCPITGNSIPVTILPIPTLPAFRRTLCDAHSKVPLLFLLIRHNLEHVKPSLWLNNPMTASLRVIRSGVAESSILLEHDLPPTGNRIPTFQCNVLLEPIGPWW
jgi:hypothetical protein